MVKVTETVIAKVALSEAVTETQRDSGDDSDSYKKMTHNKITVTETGVVTETGSERINDTVKVIGATQR